MKSNQPSLNSVGWDVTPQEVDLRLLDTDRAAGGGAMSPGLTAAVRVKLLDLETQTAAVPGMGRLAIEAWPFGSFGPLLGQAASTVVGDDSEWI